MKTEQQAAPFFFITGCGRSGTTLLRTLLDAHPGVNIALECPLIINLSFGYARRRIWREKHLEAFRRDLYKQFRFDQWKTDTEAVKQALLQYRGAYRFSDLCMAVYRQYPSNFSKENICSLGDKTIVHAHYTRRLMKLFPEARFIHMVRDYRDRNLSLSGGKPGRGQIVLKTLNWIEVQKSIEKSKAAEPHRFMTLRYEDLVNDPSAWFRKVCEFLGIAYAESVFDYHKDDGIREKLYQREFADTWQQHLFGPITAGQCGKWKEQMDPELTEISDRLAGKRAEEYGYERLFTAPAGPVRFRYFFPVLVHELVSLRRKVIDLLPFRARNFLMGRSLLLPLYRRMYGRKT